MNAITSSAETNSEDGLHRLLRDFFHNEMAKSSFSPPAIPRAEPARSPQRPTLARGRVILAVSVLAVLGSLWFLLDNRPSGSTIHDPGIMNDPTADQKSPFDMKKPANPAQSPNR